MKVPQENSKIHFVPSLKTAFQKQLIAWKKALRIPSSFIHFRNWTVGKYPAQILWNG
jgi:hypothetical protein